MNVELIRSVPRALVGLLAAGAVVAGALFVLSEPAGANQAGVAADELPPSAVEDFNYPAAVQAEVAQYGIELIRGDGHIVYLGNCTGRTDANLRLQGRNFPDYDGDGASDYMCFRVDGPAGYLKVSIPATNGIRTGDFDAEVTMTLDGETHTYTAPPGGWTPIGETAEHDGLDYTLVEIRI
ncbi:hypothetical protein C8K30_105112 [Promicromonospora sp. AC04]|uniref:hypothetical protein n=1 Tax=Promicromonospora sp. AC04 TaxID=2135723 RepID=UPI000D3D99F2|nr:hypothetical protein [Promicromonospora sp. AC04]PUB26885.1 hypothetical protein C8K30_105112 [Promicromonospora sp. AC04]